MRQPMNLQKHKTKLCRAVVSVCAALSVFPLISSCSKNAETKPVILWTDHREFVSYAELFNSTHTSPKVVVVYKASPAHSLPPQDNELNPDIVAGSYLKSTITRKYFSKLDYLFSEQKLSRDLFYPQLADYGILNKKQYLLPVSFNLPAVVFNKSEESRFSNAHLVTIDELKTLASEFNTKNRSGTFTKMGYAPSWDGSFLYLTSRLSGASYREKGRGFEWDRDALASDIEFLKDWTLSSNSDTLTEQNFQFKYLYMPKDSRLASGRSLFNFMTSQEFFSLSESSKENLTFRWIEKDSNILVEDDLVTMGLYKHGRNKKSAVVFMEWFFRPETQQALIERNVSMNMNSPAFGITGGFSSIPDVNENIFPTYYRGLLENLPEKTALVMPNLLPYRWSEIKSQVIIPYLLESTNTALETEPIPLEERMSDWSRRAY